MMFNNWAVLILMDVIQGSHGQFGGGLEALASILLLAWLRIDDVSSGVLAETIDATTVGI